PSQWFAGAEDVLLTDEILRALRTKPLRQRTLTTGGVIVGLRREIEQAHDAITLLLMSIPLPLRFIQYDARRDGSVQRLYAYRWYRASPSDAPQRLAASMRLAPDDDCAFAPQVCVRQRPCPTRHHGVYIHLPLLQRCQR